MWAMARHERCNQSTSIYNKRDKGLTERARVSDICGMGHSHEAIQNTHDFIDQTEQAYYHRNYSPRPEINMYQYYTDDEDVGSEEYDYVQCEETKEDERYEEDEKDEEDEEDDDDDEDEEDESDSSSEHSDCLEKLDMYMDEFKIQTNELIDSKRSKLEESSDSMSMSLTKLINSHNELPVIQPVPLRNPNSRRSSMLPGSEMCKEVLAFNNRFIPNNSQMLSNVIPESSSIGVSENFRVEASDSENCTKHNDNSPDLLSNIPESMEVLESLKELKVLVLRNEGKQTEMTAIEADLELTYDILFETGVAIWVKQDLIKGLDKNLEILSTAKGMFQKKREELKRKLKSKYRLNRTKIASYNDRLSEIQGLLEIINDSLRIETLADSIIASKNQRVGLLQQVKEVEKRKKELEEKFAEDEEKIHELEEKCNLTVSKLFDDERNVIKSEVHKKKRVYVGAKISHLDYVIKEMSMDMERSFHKYEKQDLRGEIEHLRRTRDLLVDEKCRLDDKLQKEKTSSTVEERKLLEFGETIEAIDAMIEHKNEMICGRKDFDENQSQREKGERMLMERLAKLSDGEMRTLFYKYFLKVIDLKESSRNLEVQIAKLESSVESRDVLIQTLTDALKTTKIAAESKYLCAQKAFQEQMHLMFKHFSKETYYHADLQSKNSKDADDKRKDTELATRLDVPSSNPVIVNDHRSQGQKNTTTTTKVTRQRNKLIIQKTTDRNTK
ncbi:kinesin-like protein costa [Andrena cerasifolii]|uniref:kinesin-like protein costa n=1 Tax=Andrena cerasifolii TaxID=2819439 RepID=UPI004037AAD8